MTAGSSTHPGASPGTLVLDEHGKRKRVEDIRKGDLLLCADGTARGALEIFSGQAPLYTVTITESMRNSHVVNARTTDGGRGRDLPYSIVVTGCLAGENLEDVSRGPGDGLVAHILSIPRTKKAQTCLRNALCDMTGVSVRTGVSASHTKSGNPDSLWDNVRVKDGAEAWRLFHEFKAENGWHRREKEFSVAKEEEGLREHLKLVALPEVM
ncbi:hypothetical protein JCM11491_000136 [Sporobolomyces phaffii]